jgi:hypothetical protein
MKCLQRIQNEKEELKIKTEQQATPEGNYQKNCEIKDRGVCKLYR